MAVRIGKRETKESQEGKESSHHLEIKHISTISSISSEAFLCVDDIILFFFTLGFLIF